MKVGTINESNVMIVFFKDGKTYYSLKPVNHIENKFNNYKIKDALLLENPEDLEMEVELKLLDCVKPKGFDDLALVTHIYQYGKDKFFVVDTFFNRYIRRRTFKEEDLLPVDKASLESPIREIFSNEYWLGDRDDENAEYQKYFEEIHKHTLGELRQAYDRELEKVNSQLE